MAKKKETDLSGEQLTLIEVQPENAKPIIKAARLYKKCQAARQAALAQEVKQKKKILELIRAAKLQPLDEGVIKFEFDRVLISVTPRDELIRIVDNNESE